MTARQPRSRAQQASLRERARELYRESIIEAAEMVFVERGVAGTRMADVARAAGIATGTLYNYFDSKQAVLHSLFEHRFDQVKARLDAAYAGARDPLARIAALVRTSFECIESYPAMPVIMHQLGAVSEAHMGTFASEFMEQRYATHVARFERAIAAAARAGHVRKDVTAPELAAFLTGAMNGFLRAWIVSGRRHALSARADAVIDLFLAGARKPGARKPGARKS